MVIAKKKDGWLSSLWNRFRRRNTRATPADFAWNPRFDVTEQGEEYRFSAEVPGIERDELHVTTVGHRLQISGMRETERVQKSDAFDVFERRRGYFARWFTLPDDADLDHATGELAGNVLTVVVPRLQTQAR